MHTDGLDEITKFDFAFILVLGIFNNAWPADGRWKTVSLKLQCTAMPQNGHMSTLHAIGEKNL